MKELHHSHIGDEEWKDGRMEEWKDGRMEEWNDGMME
jgi:hypothetical protein